MKTHAVLVLVVTATLCGGTSRADLPFTAGPVVSPSLPSGPLGPIPPIPTPPPTPLGCLTTTIEMRVLVLSATGTESTLAAIQDALDYHSVPYTTWVATEHAGQLTSTVLADGCDGKFQGVIAATGGLVYSPDGGVTWTSALTTAEWLALRLYEQQFGIREISWYVFPGSDYGLGAPTAAFDSGAAGYNGTITAPGQLVFTYSNFANPIPLRHSWTYLAAPVDPNVTTILTDSTGSALISTRNNIDGRETLAMTFDSNQHLLHHAVLAHGLVEWVTKGMYLGEFRSYLTPQEDDLYLENVMYLASSYPGGLFRLSASDVNAFHTWQTNVQAQPGLAGFRLAHAFNGWGSGSPTDSLTIAVKDLEASYNFINHTWTHPNLDSMSYADAYNELQLNDDFAQAQNFTHYQTAHLVTPEISGLLNPDVLEAMKDVGIQYTVSDSSRAGWNNPRPNIGIYSTIEPTIFHIPRRPTNLFYNVATPVEWAAEYNAIYFTFWGRALSYAEILDKESEFLFFYMMRGDLDPQMYHFPNMHAYDGVHSLLGDLHDLAIQKYRHYSTLPVMSPEMHVAGKRMQNTMARNAAGVVAKLTPGVSVSFTSPVEVEFVVSGVCTSDSENYAGKCITPVSVGAGETVTYLLVETPTIPDPPPIEEPPPPTLSCPTTTVELKVLVLSADGNESTLPAIQEALDYHSVPYSTWIASENPGELTSAVFSAACDGKFQGVILATGDLVHSADGGLTWASALTDAEWSALRTYEQQFGVREISWYVYPSSDYGLSAPTAAFDSGTTGYDAVLTTEGQTVFTYANAANPIPLMWAWTYLATPTDPTVVTLLSDAVGNSLMSTRTTSDGREMLAMTFDSNQYLLHHAVLAHGLVEWVTKGIYLGEFRASLTPQENGLFLATSMYIDENYPPDGELRIGAADITAFHTWQQAVQSQPGLSGFKLSHAFNADGSTPTDPLTLAVLAVQSDYEFISHTFTAQNLDAVDYDTAYDEFTLNDGWAESHALACYKTETLVTPDVSGLTNPEALAAMWDAGTRYTVSDTSRTGWNNPRANIGIDSTIVPGILHIPRRPTNLFYNVATPAEWVAEYNDIYFTFWGRDLTYDEILDNESGWLLFYMLRGDLDPQMYHQANIRAYDGVHSLLGDLHDLAFEKYRTYSTLPVVSVEMDVIGRRMANTMARNAAGVVAKLTPGVSVSFTSPVAVEFVVSGVCTSDSENYAGKCLTPVSVGAGETVTYLLVETPTIPDPPPIEEEPPPPPTLPSL